MPAQRWHSAGGLGLRGGEAMAYDALHREIVLFGGQLASGPANDTWIWDGSSWRERATSIAPPPRAGAAMTFDTARQRMVLYGGVDRTGAALHDTWLYDGSNWQPTAPQHVPTGLLPCALAFDTARGRGVLWGMPPIHGNTVGATETWEWNGSDWRAIATPTIVPRTEPAGLAFAPARNRVVLLTTDFYTGSLTTFDYDGNDWVPIDTVHQPPSNFYPDFLHGEMTTSANGQVLLVATSGNVSNVHTAWTFDGVDWSQLPSPPAFGRIGIGTLAHDPVRNRDVLHQDDDTLEFDGQSWQVREHHDRPPGSPQDFAWDAGRARLVTFGSYVYPGPPNNDHWEWDGSHWHLLPPVANGPSPRFGAGLAYDARRQRLVLFGGSATTTLLDTWEFDGAQWQQIITAHTPPGGGPMLYDAGRGRVLQVGAVQVWSYDGTDWSLLPAAPPPRVYAATAYDSAADRILRFGGRDLNFGTLHTDLWELRGNTWTLVPVTGPLPPPAPPFVSYLCAFDVARGRLVIAQGHFAPDTTFEFDGTHWTALPTSWLPTTLVPMLYDTNQQRVLLVGAEYNVFALEPPRVAVWTRLGTGCAGSAGTPSLDGAPGSAPVLGAAFALTFANLPPAPGALWLAFGLGFARANGRTLPLELGAIGLPGCDLWLELAPGQGRLVLHNGGTASTMLAIPAAPALAGQRFGTQAFVLDAAASNGIGAVTNAGFGTVH